MSEMGFNLVAVNVMLSLSFWQHSSSALLVAGILLDMLWESDVVCNLIIVFSMYALQLSSSCSMPILLMVSSCGEDLLQRWVLR